MKNLTCPDSTRVLAMIALLAASRLPASADTNTGTDSTLDPWGEAGVHKPQVETGVSYDPYTGNATRIVAGIQREYKEYKGTGLL